MADITFASSKTGKALNEQLTIVAERTKAEQIKDNFYTALDGPANNGLASKYGAMTGGQKKHGAQHTHQLGHGRGKPQRGTGKRAVCGGVPAVCVCGLSGGAGRVQAV